MNKPKVRILLSALVTVAIMVYFIYTLMNIQIVEPDKYTKMLGDNSQYQQVIKATRGEIVASNGDPLAGNRMGYDVIIDRATLPVERRNEIILGLTELFEKLGEKWIDNLPITKNAPFQYLPDSEDEIARVKKLLNVNDFATAADIMYWLEESYGTGKRDENGERVFTPQEARKIIGVRYEMAQRGFNYSVPYTFATDVKISSVIEIKEQSYLLSGVDVVESTVRVHPENDLAPHLIGLIGPIYAEEYAELKDKGYSADDKVGKSGSEFAFEEYLRGEDGVRDIFCDENGIVVQDIETAPPVPGNTVVLTIDKELQRVAQEALEKQIKNLQETSPVGQGREADVGAAVAIEVKTGKVLACATYPNYDINRYFEDYEILADENGLKPLYNRALLGTYAPGSCFKPVIGAAGLGEGIIGAGSTYHCGRVFMLPGSTQHFTCLGFHGNINVLNAMRWSCNIFFYNTGNYLGIDRIDAAAKAFGLGEKTGIELPERQGQRSNPEVKMKVEEKEWYPGDTLQSSIGQLYHSFTPIQLANYAATLANRGTRMKLTIVDEIRDYSQQTVVQPFEAQIADKLDYNAEAFETTINGMVMASRIGTAMATFGNYPVDVASKTGTPESSELPNSTFICFAPAEDPQIAVAIVIEKGWHGYTGAPVARDIFDQYFGY